MMLYNWLAERLPGGSRQRNQRGGVQAFNTRIQPNGVGTSSGANKDRSSTKKDGIGIDTRQGESQHFGPPLLQRAPHACAAETRNPCDSFMNEKSLDARDP